MRWILSGLITAHGLIHLIGFAKAFGLGDFGQITQSISRGLGILWLTASMAMFATAALYAADHRFWWLVGFVAVVLSQAVIITAWSEAKFGTILNLVILVGVFYGFASQGPPSFRARYFAEVRGRLTDPVSPAVVTEEDLAPLPEPVACYIRLSGAVGRPRVHHFRAVWRGRIRQSADDTWMEFTAEQVNFMEESARFFIMDARKTGLPVDVFHAFDENGASMRVRLLSIVPLLDVRGREVDQTETVTIFNDLCLLAPDRLADPGIRFEPVDERSTRAWYSRGDHTISAVLSFNDRCELTNFTSDDRLAAMGNDKGFMKMPFSTPVGEYREFGTRRVMTRGEALWHPPEGEYTYLELELVDYEANGPAP
jgi:hypothetical protein